MAVTAQSRKPFITLRTDTFTFSIDDLSAEDAFRRINQIEDKV